MSRPTFAADFSQADVEQVLCEPAVRERVVDLASPDHDQTVTHLSRGTFLVSGAAGDFILRFPRDEQQLSMLQTEESVQNGMRGFVSARIPDTTVVIDIDACPAFAIHRLIPGRPLTSEEVEELLPEPRDRLAGDLVGFFRETHAVPLDVACGWLGLPFDGEETVFELATIRGKPMWFSADAVAEMRPELDRILDDDQMALFRDTVGRFNALEMYPANMVFGHGDMHGYNMAIGQDEQGPRLVGAFDLGCVGILDVHEDFFRLSLISEDLLERVMALYASLPGQKRLLSRDRIAVYYRAFLFYLMVGQSGEGLDHLKRLLHQHLEYYDGF